MRWDPHPVQMLRHCGRPQRVDLLVIIQRVVIDPQAGFWGPYGIIIQCFGCLTTPFSSV
jgi:hypothetical protein